MNENEVVDILAEAMITIGNYLTDKSPSDKTQEGTIESINGNSYRVETCGSYYNITENNDTYIVGDKVWVTIPCNDYDRMFILKKRSD